MTIGIGMVIWLFICACIYDWLAYPPETKLPPPKDEAERRRWLGYDH